MLCFTLVSAKFSATSEIIKFSTSHCWPGTEFAVRYQVCAHLLYVEFNLRESDAASLWMSISPNPMKVFEVGEVLQSTLE